MKGSKTSKKKAVEFIWSLFEADEIALNSRYNGSLKGLASVVYKVFDKNIGSAVNVSKVLFQELH